MRSILSIGVAALVGVAMAGCSDTARIKTSDEQMLIDQKKGGTVVYRNIVKGTLEKMLADAHQKVVRESQKKYLVAFIGIDNKGAEELGDNEEASYDQIEETLLNSGYYDIVSKRFVDAARREAQVRSPDDLFLKGATERFMSVLKRDGLVPDYLLWGKMTTQTSKHDGVFVDSKERAYRFSMEMIDANTGQLVAKRSEENIKAYSDY